MTINENKIPKYLVYLLIISVLIRAFLAAFVEFGNDEVYYWTYAMFPDWSHFDHPGMVGWVMQLFSLNLLFNSELALRLSSVIFMTADTYIVYRIGCEIKNRLTGFYAALLYTSSIYAFIITGIFIMPDTPLSLFMLLSIWCFIKYFSSGQAKHILLAGLFAGLAILSKYSAIFLWVGAGLYILVFDRNKLKIGYLYLSVLISLVCMLPLLIWNIQNDFISFTFHGDRVGLFGEFHPEYFLTEIFGELIYNNPVCYVLTIIALVSLFKGNKYLDKTPIRFLLLFALPLIGMFWFFSLTRRILPHWTSPAIVVMTLFPAAYLADKNLTENIKLPKSITASLIVLFVILFAGVTEIKTGIIPLRFTEKSRTIQRWNEGDFTTTIYGWRQIKPKFEKIRQDKISQGLMKETDGMVNLKWYPLANLDYYVAHPLNMNMYGLGDMQNLHKYSWINEYRGGMQKGSDYWFLTESSDYYEPDVYLKDSFEEIIPCDTIVVDRCGTPAKYVFVYICRGYK